MIFIDKTNHRTRSLILKCLDKGFLIKQRPPETSGMNFLGTEEENNENQ